jgi:hypothetical protein
MLRILFQQIGKLLEVEYAQVTFVWDFAHCGGQEAMVVVAISGLHENGGVRQTLSVNSITGVIQMNPYKIKVKTYKQLLQVI